MVTIFYNISCSINTSSPKINSINRVCVNYFTPCNKCDVSGELIGSKHAQEWKKNNEDVIAANGLHILGTERHESRRIDNQLRGRSGRQGDPGYSRFFLSLEDDLLRLFISDNRRNLFEKIGMGDDHIEHKMLSRGIENAQKRIESKNFDARKNLLEYDDVSNDQRQAIYSLRNQLLEEDDISETIQSLISIY